jgi:hypothetical protein
MPQLQHIGYRLAVYLIRFVLFYGDALGRHQLSVEVRSSTRHTLYLAYAIDCSYTLGTEQVSNPCTCEYVSLSVDEQGVDKRAFNVLSEPRSHAVFQQHVPCQLALGEIVDGDRLVIKVRRLALVELRILFFEFADLTLFLFLGRRLHVHRGG